MSIKMLRILLKIITWTEARAKVAYRFLVHYERLVAVKPEFKSGEFWDWALYGCPGCGGNLIYEGPEGGACQNICCANSACQRAFNLGIGIEITWDIDNHYFQHLFEPEPEKFGMWKNA